MLQYIKCLMVDDYFKYNVIFEFVRTILSFLSLLVGVMWQYIDISTSTLYTVYQVHLTCK